MLLYYDGNNIVRAVTERPLVTNMYKCVEVHPLVSLGALGKRIVFGDQTDRLRVAVICNWGDACGIATYSQYLVDAMSTKVDALKVFAEETSGAQHSGDHDVTFCWKRGESMRRLVQEIVEWEPTVVLIQHEFGIFPKATYWLQLLQLLDSAKLPYAVTMHSVYQHLDKTICSAAIRNIIVHTQTGEACLRRLGHNQQIEVIPHGCVQFHDVQEHWNITKTDHALMQFGFGFDYKGVERVLEAIALLKKRHPRKYNGEHPIHYLYLCSESPHVKATISEYHGRLMREIERLGLGDNAVILRGFQTDEMLNNYLRTYKLAVFPYVTNPNFVVYGASGAIRIAMANGIPTLASSSHMFDDMEGVLPRPSSVEEIAKEIDKVFSDERYRTRLKDRAAKYVADNTWDKTADRYAAFLRRCLDGSVEDAIFV